MPNDFLKKHLKELAQESFQLILCIFWEGILALSQASFYFIFIELSFWALENTSSPLKATSKWPLSLTNVAIWAV